MKKLDIVLTVVLVAVFLLLGFWGAAQEWAGAADFLPFILLFIAGAYIIFEGVRLSSALIVTLLGGLIPLTIFIPSLSIYTNVSVEEAIPVAVGGCILGFVVSTISRLVKKNKKAQIANPAIGENASEEAGTKTAQLTGIQGWLILPAIGLPLGLLLYAVNIIQSFVFWFSSDYRDVAGQYGGVWFLTAFEILGKISLFIYLCFLLRAFYKQKKSVPKRVIIYFITSVVFAAIRFGWGLAIFGVEDEAVFLSLLRSTGIVGIIISSAVWITYFKRSERVKLTFVKD